MKESISQKLSFLVSRLGFLKCPPKNVIGLLTLIYFEKNYQQCGNKKYKKYKYCCDLIVVWIPQVPRNCFRRFKKLDNFTKISQT